MSNAKRPANVRKVTTKTEANRREALDAGLRFKYDGEWLYLRAADVSSELAREFRKVTGHSFRWLMETIAEDFDIDLLTDAVWVAKRIRGDEVEVDEIRVDYALIASDDFDIEEAGPRAAQLQEVGTDPEASGGAS